MEFFIAKQANVKSLTELPSVEIWRVGKNPYYKDECPISEFYEDRNVMVIYTSEDEEQCFGINNQVEVFIEGLIYEYFNYVMCKYLSIEIACAFDKWMLTKGILTIFGEDFYSDEVKIRTIIFDAKFHTNTYR
jgi:hypothetical protein